NEHRQEELIVESGLIDEGLAGVDEVAQSRHLQRHAQTNVGDKDLVADGGGDGQGHTEGEDTHQIGQQVCDHDAPGGGTQATGSQVVLPVPYDDHLIAHKAGGGQPGGETHGEDHGGNAGAEDVGDDDDHQGLGHVVKDIVELGEEEVQLADIAPQHAHD